jgi:type 1 glutamine amidotransferase
LTHPVRRLFRTLYAATVLLPAGLDAQAGRPVSILVYTKNGPGYAHQNVPSAVAALRKLGSEHGMAIDVTDDPSAFTEARLSRYTLLLFASTTNDVFDTDEQRLALRRYIEAGGGFVGLHSVAVTERSWPWFRLLVGAAFAWHPPFQTLRLTRVDPVHPSVRDLPASWTKRDELYFLTDIGPGITVVLAHDLTAGIAGDSARIQRLSAPFKGSYPAAWHQRIDGGRIWITTLGHDKSDYQDPTYLTLVLGGIRFVASESRGPDFRKAYSTRHDAPTRAAPPARP